MILRCLAGSEGHCVQADRIGEQGDGRRCHGFNVAYFAKDAVHAVFDQFWHAADAGRDGGDAAGHGLKCGEAKGFHL